MAEDAVDISMWRQGDACLDVKELPVLVGSDIVDVETEGVVVVSQTCDIVRSYHERPFVQVARLVAANDDELNAVRRFQRPRYAYIPALAAHRLVADLDVVATVDKSNLADWSRTAGCGSSLEQRELGFALGRHRSRFAFPDAWSLGLTRLRRWVLDKSKRNSEEGQFVRGVEQMRIRAEDTDNPTEIEIICIISGDTELATRAAWIKNIFPRLPGLVDKDWCPKATFRLSTPEEMSAFEYLESYRLDLDALTTVR